jgi:EAL domain-containing protein (putative c-di-GMP-specific phosphodiesterase class I)
VESARIYAAVQGMACDEAQGYHISRPLPAALVVGWLRLHATPPAPRDDARPG